MIDTLLFAAVAATTNILGITQHRYVCPTNTVSVDPYGTVTSIVTKAYVEDLGINGFDTNAVDELIAKYDETNLTARIAAKQDALISVSDVLGWHNWSDTLTYKERIEGTIPTYTTKVCKCYLKSAPRFLEEYAPLWVWSIRVVKEGLFDYTLTTYSYQDETNTTIRAEDVWEEMKDDGRFVFSSSFGRPVAIYETREVTNSVSSVVVSSVTDSATNLVSSLGIKNALDAKQDELADYTTTNAVKNIVTNDVAVGYGDWIPFDNPPSENWSLVFLTENPPIYYTYELFVDGVSVAYYSVPYVDMTVANYINGMPGLQLPSKFTRNEIYKNSLGLAYERDIGTAIAAATNHLASQTFVKQGTNSTLLVDRGFKVQSVIPSEGVYTTKFQGDYDGTMTFSSASSSTSGFSAATFQASTNGFGFAAYWTDPAVEFPPSYLKPDGSMVLTENGLTNEWIKATNQTFSNAVLGVIGAAATANDWLIRNDWDLRCNSPGSALTARYNSTSNMLTSVTSTTAADAYDRIFSNKITKVTRGNGTNTYAIIPLPSGSTTVTTIRTYTADAEGSYRKLVNDAAKAVLDVAKPISTHSNAYNSSYTLYSSFIPRFTCAYTGTGAYSTFAVSPHVLASANHIGPHSESTQVFDDGNGNRVTVQRQEWRSLKDWAYEHGFTTNQCVEAGIMDISVIPCSKTTAVPDGCIPYFMRYSTFTNMFGSSASGLSGWRVSQDHTNAIPVVFYSFTTSYNYPLYYTSTNLARSDIRDRLSEMGSQSVIYSGDSGKPQFIVINGSPVILFGNHTGGGSWCSGNDNNFVKGFEILKAYVEWYGDTIKEYIPEDSE